MMNTFQNYSKSSKCLDTCELCPFCGAENEFYPVGKIVSPQLIRSGKILHCLKKHGPLYLQLKRSIELEEKSTTSTSKSEEKEQNVSVDLEFPESKDEGSSDSTRERSAERSNRWTSIDDGRLRARRWRRNRIPPIRTMNRCIVSGLPKKIRWQELKDHMREAGKVCFADIHRDGTGVVDYVHHADMKYAVRIMDKSKVRSRFGETFVRVREEDNMKRRSSTSSSSVPRSPPSYSPSSRRRSTKRSRSRSTTHSKSP